MYFIVAGEGGHLAQAKRLVALLDQSERENIVHITDNTNHLLTNKVIALNPLRCKDNSYSLNDVVNFFKNIKKVYKSFGLYTSTRVISLGPGIAIPVALIAKSRGIKVVHIETWSRIRSKSITGRIMYYLSDEFIVQHKSLTKLYPKSTYGGLL